MQLIVPISDLRFSLQHLEHVFFFLSNGVDSAIIFILEEYIFPRNTELEFSRDFRSANIILIEFERHVDTLEISNSCPKNLNNIYALVELAIAEVRFEVDRLLQQYLVDQAVKVISADHFTPFDCLIQLDVHA